MNFKQSKNDNWADQMLVEKYILQNDFTYVAPRTYECPGGHIWNECHIIDSINNMTLEQQLDLSKYGE